MGTQQILLIVLSVIIVGIAVAVGISMFNTQSVAADQQAIAADLQSFGAQVLAYLKTPTSMGGGGAAITDATDGPDIGAWLGWGGAQLINDNDTYNIVTAADLCTITAVAAGSSVVIDNDDTSMSDVVVSL